MKRKQEDGMEYLERGLSDTQFGFKKEYRSRKEIIREHFKDFKKMIDKKNRK